MSIAALPVPPSFGMLGIEPLRAAFEFAGMHLMDRSRLPVGDGHPVVLFPGLATDRRALAPLRRCSSASSPPLWLLPSQQPRQPSRPTPRPTS